MTRPEGLSAEERARLAEGYFSYTFDVRVFAAVESVIAARLAAQREDIAQQIENQCVHTLDGVTACEHCAEAARIARGGIDEH